MDKTPKPKTTLKEIRRKMKKMTLAEKKQVKEEKEQQKQKEKESKQKQKITQRVKININIPSQKTSSPQIQNPFSSSNIDQINLLTSINEQLKRKDEPKKAAENFNLPIRQQKQVYEYGTQTEPKQQKQVYEYGTQTNDEPFIQEKPKSEVRFENIYNEPDFPEFKLPPQFSEKEIPKVPIIKEPRQPIITKPKDTSSQSLPEKVKSPSNFLEELMAQQKIIKPKTEEETKQMEQNIKEQMKDPNKPPRGRKPDTEEVKQQKAKQKEEQELMKAEEKRQKAEQKVQEKKIKDQEERDRVEMENIRITERAFRILLDNTPLEQQKELQDIYARGFLKDKEIKDNLKKLNFSAEEIKRIFSKENK